MDNKDTHESNRLLTLGNHLKISKKCMIIGYKFGIYGYLPALINCGYNNIVIDHKAINFISNLPKLKHLIKHVEIIKDYKSNEDFIETIILAIPPDEQYKIIMSTLNLNLVKNIILEKPLAANPKQASSLLNNLNQRKIIYKVNYSFLYTNWYHETKEKVLGLGLNTFLKISWSFKAHQSSSFYQ